MLSTGGSDGSASASVSCDTQNIPAMAINNILSQRTSVRRNVWRAKTIFLTICFNISLLKCVWDPFVKRDLIIGIVLKSCWISERGFHPTKTSKLPMITAISGLSE
jgi:hypothetical protein